MPIFPKDFLWGAATSSYQVEGDNSNCDWWEWEKKVGLKDVSGHACRHYDLFREDFDKAAELNHNAHRISIEWSRIEPSNQEFSESQLKHYIDVIDALRQRNIEPIVTLHHFTNPLWFSRLGGWESGEAEKFFLRYVKFIVNALSEKVRFWVTINEPNVYAYHAYLIGAWPPQKKSISKTRIVLNNLANAHISCYKAIHDIYRSKGLNPPFVSIAHNAQAFVPCKDNLRNKIACALRNKWYNLDFIDKLFKHRALDYIGINYYTRSLVEVKGWGIHNLILDVCTSQHHPLAKNSLGWDIYPQGLYDVLKGFKKYNLPIIITENGICTEDDSLRWDYISEHLKMVHRALKDGIKVKGYIYWSLMDNFEWDKGFSHRFGLISIDYNNFARTIRQSAVNFANVCKTGSLD
ncbi:MAG: glycoside hydrolase family 1 protein [Candidatus Omnitrophica bacterium]|nr:glycoside hydrolase family 1 protein [Candidatus Omnitrophota bacterium]